MSAMSIADVLEHAERLFPQKVAVIDGDTRLTYREAANRVRRFAAGLLELGHEPGQQLGFLANNSHHYWEAYYVAHYAGAPLAALNTRLSDKELEFIIRDGEVRTLVVGPEFVEQLSSFRDQLEMLDRVIVIADEAPEGMVTYESVVRSAPAPLEKAAKDWDEDDMVILNYTGGTTGLPKGVMLTQRNVIANAQHVLMTFDFREDDVWMHAAPMFHLADAWACYAITMVGGTHVIIPGFQPELFMQTAQDARVTCTILVPTMINFVVHHPEAHDYDFSALRLVLFGASPMSVDRIMAAREIFGDVLCQAYGMTETAPLLTAQQKHWIDYESEAGLARLASCGREVIGVRVRVVDEEGKDVPPGGVGNVIASGPNVMKGYWKRPEETAAALRDGCMHTGDVARIDEEGFIYIVDRSKDMIISGGENIYSTEVEAAIYQHPSVLEAAVIGIPNERWGETVHAVITLKPDTSATEQEIIDHCHELIAGYKCPKSVSFISEGLPKSGPGKILKNELRKPFWEGQDKGVS